MREHPRAEAGGRTEPAAEEVVQNLNQLLVTLEGKVEAIDTGALASDLDGLVEGLRRSLRGSDLPDLSREVRETFGSIDATVARLQRLLDGGQLDIQLGIQLDIQMALENLRVTSENLRDLTESLRAQPSLLLRGTGPDGSGIPQ